MEVGDKLSHAIMKGRAKASEEKLHRERQLHRDLMVSQSGKPGCSSFRVSVASSPPPTKTASSSSSDTSRSNTGGSSSGTKSLSTPESVSRASRSGSTTVSSGNEVIDPPPQKVAKKVVEKVDGRRDRERDREEFHQDKMRGRDEIPEKRRDKESFTSQRRTIRTLGGTPEVPCLYVASENVTQSNR